MFHRTRQGAVEVIATDDPLTHEHADELAVEVEHCKGHGQPMVVLDMQRIPLLDSAGLERLLDCQEELESNGGILKLAAPSSLCQDILGATGVASQFEIFGDVKSAVGSFLR